MTGEPATRCGYAAIVGAPNAGKSTLLNRLTGAKLSIVSPKAQTSRHLVTGILTTEEAQCIFVDLPGYQTRHVNALNKALNRRATEAAKDCDVTLFVVEAGRLGEEDRQVLARIRAPFDGEQAISEDAHLRLHLAPEEVPHR